MLECPKCGSGRIYWEYACHTYQVDGRWMGCMPCDSAIRYVCFDCKWSYTWGLNPDNPRAVENEKQKPSWELGTVDGDFMLPAEGTVHVGSFPDDWYEAQRD